MPFNLGPAELVIVLALALIVFGPKKLPEIGRGIGNALREFQKARNDFMETINSEVDREEPAHAVRTSSAYDDLGSEEEDGRPVRSLEYPEPLAPENADALPYGSDFQAIDTDSQPSFRTVEAAPDPVAAAEPSGPAPARQEQTA